jgi:hypothetical protein
MQLANTQPPPFTDDDLDRVSRDESVTPVSVLRAWVGLEVRGMAGARARRAVAKLRGSEAAPDGQR